MADSKGAACECGQVVFDTSRAKPGEILTCPWCWKHYRYENGSITLANEDETKRAEAEAKKETPPPKPKSESLEDEAALLKRKSSRFEKVAEEKKERTSEKKVEAAKPAEDKAKSERLLSAEAAAPSSASQKQPKEKKLKLEDIPGEMAAKIVCIMGFNGLAFIIDYLLWKPADDGGRNFAFGHFYLPEHKIWPELIALVAGHVFGFIAWMIVVGKLHDRHQAKLTADKEAKAKREADRKARAAGSA